MHGNLNKAGDEADDTLGESVLFLYGHPEAFTTMLGKELLESNEEKECTMECCNVFL